MISKLLVIFREREKPEIIILYWSATEDEEETGKKNKDNTSIATRIAM